MSEKSNKIGPRFYTAVTVGDRGQIVIPAEARRDMGISPGDRLVILGEPGKGHLMIHKEESMRKFVEIMIDQLNKIDQLDSNIDVIAENISQSVKKEEE